MKKLELKPEDKKIFACLWEGMLTAEEGISTGMLTKFNRVMSKLEDISVGNDEFESETAEILSAKKGRTVVNAFVVNRELTIEETEALEFEDEDFNYLYKRLNACTWSALAAKHAAILLDKLNECKKQKDE